MSKYTTSPGKDEREIDYPSVYSEAQIKEFIARGIYFINWHGYAMAVGPGLDTQFFDEIMSRKREVKSVIIVITGPPGEGKTWAGLRICEMFDKDFDVKKQVCFTREHILKILSDEIKVEPGQAILIDEPQFAVGARSWYEKLQKELLNQVAAIRSRGYIVVIIALHLSLIDRIIRNFMVTYQMYMEGRGRAAEYTVKLHRFDDPSKYPPRTGTIILPPPGNKWCTHGIPGCLKCRFSGLLRKNWDKRDRWKEMGYDPCMNMRAIYERAKREFLSSRSKKSLQSASDAADEEEKPSDEKMMEMLYDDRVQLKFTSRGNIDWKSVRYLLKKRGVKLGTTSCQALANDLQMEYPDLKPTEGDN